MLTVKRGALVHFAADDDNVSMTTRLTNSQTRFLPFNRGRDGGAKAMVVTSSRAHALRYYFAIRDYLNARGYDDMRVIVAFSGELEHEGETWTEAALNGFSETELPRRFKETPELRFLVVAEKYQTGFDEPALCAMYVDRKLAGLQAVQTLSRLNRTHSRFPNKRTFVLDFQNTTDEIQEAFKPYFEASELEDVTNPNQIYELYDRLLKFSVIDRTEVELFAETYFAGMLAGAGSGGDPARGDAVGAGSGGDPARGDVVGAGSGDAGDTDPGHGAGGTVGVGKARRGATSDRSAGGLTTSDRIRLEGLMRQAVERFRALDGEGEQEEFRQLLRSYMRFYSFVAQVVTLGDADLEKMYAYASWLSRLLPNRDIPEEIEITDDMLALYAFRVERVRAGDDGGDYDISLRPGETETLEPIGRFGANPYTEEEKRSLSEIIETFNERHGTNFSADILRMEQVNDELLADEDNVEMLRNNPPDVAITAFAELFCKASSACSNGIGKCKAFC